MDATATFLVGQQKALETVLSAFVKHVDDRPAWTTDDPSRVRFNRISNTLEATIKMIEEGLGVQ